MLYSDVYDRGFNKGKQDAIAGKPRDALSNKEGFRSLFAMHPRNYTDTYIKGYKEGYRIGLIKKALKEDDQKKQDKKKTKWFYSDAYDRGFENGVREANLGKPRNVLNTKAGLQSLVAWNNKVYMNTYSQGYKEGYRIGLIKKELPKDDTVKTEKQESNSNLSNFSSMQRGIDGQIELLEQMKTFLSHLSEEFDEIIKKQESFVRAMDSEWLDHTVLQRFEEDIEENRAKLNGLIEDIEDEQISYVDKVIRHLEDTPR